jgi:hypothetical protein
VILFTQYLFRAIVGCYFISTVVCVRGGPLRRLHRDPQWSIVLISTVSTSNSLLILLITSVKDCICIHFKTQEGFKIIKKAFETECLLQSRLQSSVRKALYIAGKSHVFWILLMTIRLFRPCDLILTLKTHILIFSQVLTLLHGKLSSEREREREVNVIFNPSVTYSVERGLEFWTLGKKNCHALF